jgi:hypothetical protein
MARTKKTTVIGDVTRRVERAQTQATKVFGRARTRAEKVLEQGWKATLEALPTPARKAVKETTARIEKVATDLEKRRAEAFKLATRQRKDLLGRFEKERKTLVGRLAKQRKELTSQGIDLAGRIEKGAVAVVKPLVRRLDVASRSDIERLNKRVAMLERRLGRKVRHAAAA